MVCLRGKTTRKGRFSLTEIRNDITRCRLILAAEMAFYFSNPQSLFLLKLFDLFDFIDCIAIKKHKSTLGVALRLYQALIYVESNSRYRHTR